MTEFTWEVFKRPSRGHPKPLSGPDDARHGTANAYNHYGCRCRRCKDEVNARQRAYYRKRAAG